MEYEKIILDLITKVKDLEEKVAFLEAEIKDQKQTEKQPGTSEIKQFITKLKTEAAEKGQSYIDLKANEIHKMMGLKSRMPAVCNAMKQSMLLNDTILHETASGFSSTYEVRYKVKR